MTNSREIRHFHLFAGLGGGAKGFNQARPRVGNMRARCHITHKAENIIFRYIYAALGKLGYYCFNSGISLFSD